MDFLGRWQQTSLEAAQAIHLLSHDLDVLRERIDAATAGWAGWQAPSRREWEQRSTQASSSLKDVVAALRHIERDMRSRNE